MNPTRQTHTVEIAGLERKLPLFEVAPGVRIAVFNMLGDTEFVQACARALAEQLSQVSYDVLVTAEAKSIPLAYALAVEMKKPYVVLRKTYKPYMGETLSAETLSITTGSPQTLCALVKSRVSGAWPQMLKARSVSRLPMGERSLTRVPPAPRSRRARACEGASDRRAADRARGARARCPIGLPWFALLPRKASKACCTAMTSSSRPVSSCQPSAAWNRCA